MAFSWNNIPYNLSLGLRPSFMARTLPGLINDLRNSEREDEVKLSILNDYLRKCHEELFLTAVFKEELPQYWPMVVNGLELLKEEIAQIEEGMESEEEQQLDLNDPIIDHEQQSDNPTHVNERQETNQTADFVLDHPPKPDLTPFLAKLRSIESYVMEIKQRPLTQPIWKNDRILWTSELHARFVATLKLLGGPEVAKPKQITESMQVDGLTTDQVKSHLQRYRLTWRSERGAALEEMRALRVYMGELIADML